jgi:hypothetical protein
VGKANKVLFAMSLNNNEFNQQFSCGRIAIFTKPAVLFESLKEYTVMNKIFRLTTLSLVIAALGATGVRAQETAPAPGGTTTPDTTSPVTPTTPDTTTPAPGTATPATPTAPTPDAPIQGGLCNAAVTSSAANSEMTYTAGLEENSNSASTYSGSVGSSTPSTVGPNAAPNPATIGSAADTSTTSSAGNVPGRASAYSSEGVNLDAPRLIAAHSNQAQERHEIGPAHRIKLYTGASPLCYLSIKPVSSTIEEANEKIRVFTETDDRNELGITVTREQDGGARVVFAQPVPPRSTIEVVLNGVNYNSQTSGNTVLYSLAGGHADFSQEIPYGVAQINRFLY